MASFKQLLGHGYVLVVLFTHVCCEIALPEDVKQQIRENQADVAKIIDYVMTGDGKHKTMDLLAEFTDKYGPRLAGSQVLEDSIDYAKDQLKAQGFNVATEDVTVEKWTRNRESLTMLEPLSRDMSLLSLGSSVGTNGTIEGEVIVVRDFDELDAKAKENPDVFKDKIVLYNQIWDGYGPTNLYRSTGASRAAQYQAKAALVRSVTDVSLYTPHTGLQTYNLTVSSEKIPVASVTVEDAHLMQRYYDRGVTVKVRLNMTCVNAGTITTRNLVADLTGSSKPNEIVLFGGHIDSWDAGFGVMDDGGGVAVTWQALLNLEALKLKPKRTIRAIFWTAEEIGLIGAEHYYQAHKDEHENISIIMESDSGTFKPFGLGFSGTESARAIIREILSLLQPINATGVDAEGIGPDTGMWIAEKGVPGAILWNANDKYFNYHHSNADSITMEDPDDLDLCVILWTVSAYVIANLADKLPREEIYEDVSGASVAHSSQSTILLATICVILLRRLS